MLRNYDFWDWIEKSKLLKALGALFFVGTVIFGIIELFDTMQFFSVEVTGLKFWKIIRILLATFIAIVLLLATIGAYGLIVGRTFTPVTIPSISVSTVTFPAAIFEEKIVQTDLLRIFASNGDGAKKLLIDFHAKGKYLSRNLVIRVLLRDEPGNNQRHLTNMGQTRRWKTDVDRMLSVNGTQVRTEFAYHESSVMLCGYIFDSSYCLLSWYARSREGDYRSPARLPLFALGADDDDMKKLIDTAVGTFDFHFSNGVQNV